MEIKPLLSKDCIFRTSDKLTEKQLFALHAEVAGKINDLKHKRHFEALANHRVGDKVYFDGPDGRIQGEIIRVNRKTVSIITDGKDQWNVLSILVKKVIQKNVKQKKWKINTRKISYVSHQRPCITP